MTQAERLVGEVSSAELLTAPADEARRAVDAKVASSQPARTMVELRVRSPSESRLVRGGQPKL